MDSLLSVVCVEIILMDSQRATNEITLYSQVLGRVLHSEVKWGDKNILARPNDCLSYKATNV
jgi:hypothetical protein